MESSPQARSHSSMPGEEPGSECLNDPPDPATNSEVLNEIVRVALRSTRASAAAIALVERAGMVCRATVGEHAPAYGARLNTSEGLSGACVQSRQVEVCEDTELDPRVDLAASRALGARSILVVPILAQDRLLGIMELFSPRTQAFTDTDLRIAEALTQRVRDVVPRGNPLGPPQASIPAGAAPGDRVSLTTELLQGVPDESRPAEPASESPPEFPPETLLMSNSEDAAEVRPHQDFVSSILTAVVVVLAIVLGILLELHREHSRAARASEAPSLPATKTEAVSQTMTSTAAADTGSRAGSAVPSPMPVLTPPADHKADANRRASLEGPGGLTVYQNDKVIFSVPPRATSMHSADSTVAVLAPDAAEKLLAERVEPDYPPAALAAKIQGSVELHMTVDTTGQVVRARVSDGPPELAQAAADAVRRWRFHPYTVNGQPQPFRTTTVIDFKLQ
jgi:TonB family protein